MASLRHRDRTSDVILTKMHSLHGTRILVVEDDARLAGDIGDFLAGHEYSVLSARDGATAMAHLAAAAVDLVVLDWMLPDTQGIDVCRRIRESRSSLPILMVTARSGDPSEVEALNAGVDDFLRKPVRPAVLLARLHALQRRATPSTGTGPTIIGDVVVDDACRVVTISDVPISLTDAEYDLVRVLADHPGLPISRDALSRQLRGIPYDGLDRLLDIRVSRIRRKFDLVAGGSALIRGVRSGGYTLVGRAEDV